jgi:hypothetical protein
MALVSADATSIREISMDYRAISFAQKFGLFDE